MKDQTLLLSDEGSDRASAYHMSNKFAYDGKSLWVTWLANPYQVRISQVCPRTWQVQAQVPIAQGYDNHCGASLVLQRSGRLHAICGAHHQAFIHRASDTPADPHAWSLPHAVGKLATYPSTAIDSEERYLHLAYRSSTDPWSLVYQRGNLANDPPTWTGPPQLKTLLRAPSKGYCYWTNSLAMDSGGTLHLLAEFYKQHVAPNGFSPAVTHLYSEDQGDTWRHTDGREMELPSGLEQVTPIIFRGGGDVRSSKLIVCRDGMLAFTMIDPVRQELLFARRIPGQKWEIFDWTKNLQRYMPDDKAFCGHAVLAEDSKGGLQGCLVTGPEYNFGDKGRLLHIRVDRNREQPISGRVLPPWREGHIDWLASMAAAPEDVAPGQCVLLHQSGGRGKGCINAASTQVVLRVLGE